MLRVVYILIALISLVSCGAAKQNHSDSSVSSDADITDVASADPLLDNVSSDSLYTFVKKQVEFGPRIPGSAAHRAMADWLVATLKSYGAHVYEQTSTVTAFDGTRLPMRNILARFGTGDSRTMLVAHYDTRPWADKDPDPANRKTPIDGANDGGSGVAVLLEVARILQQHPTADGVDMLFVDCEDYGAEENEDSWALGAEYFATHPIPAGFHPKEVILLDMVGGKNARFPAEYFSRQRAAALDDAFRTAAARAGVADRFPNIYGGAVTDDHLKFQQQGIPAIDIIEFDPERGFNPTWHTLSDNLQNIDSDTMAAVTRAVLRYLDE